MALGSSNLLFGTDMRAAQVQKEYDTVRRQARDIILHKMPPEGYPSVETARPDTEAAVQEAKTPAWSWEDVRRLAQELALDFGGYGPLQPHLDDPETIEIMLRGVQMWVEKHGVKQRVPNSGFRDTEHVRLIVDRILLRTGRRIDESSPIVDSRITFDDGTTCRVNAVVEPIAVAGPYLTIRKFQRGMTPQRYVASGAAPQEWMDFLAAAVRARLNLIVSGGTSSGKTTVMNVLGHFMMPDERIVTIEDTLELAFPLEHVLPHETRPPNIEGKGEITIRHLVKNGLRQRPDRVVVGEVRGGEALDMIQAMNTGHDGSMNTLHANGPREALARLETMAMMADDVKMPQQAIREQIASAVDLIVQAERSERGGKAWRGIVSITGVDGLEADGEYRLTPLFWRENDLQSVMALAEAARASRAVQKLVRRGEEVSQWFR